VWGLGGGGGRVGCGPRWRSGGSEEGGEREEGSRERGDGEREREREREREDKEAKVSCAVCVCGREGEFINEQTEQPLSSPFPLLLL
jgi:hypothetical protein